MTDASSAARLLRRLSKERADIHARVLLGEISLEAGVAEARLREKREKLSRVERAQKQIMMLTWPERVALSKWLTKLIGS